MTDPEQPSTELQLQAALAEYRALWEYYHRLFGEWTTLTDRYFKVVTLPGAAVAFLLVKGIGPLPRDALVAILLLVFLIGVGLYVTYAKECGNANYYEAALQRLRDFLAEHSAVPDVRALNVLRARRSRWSMGGIKAWRGGTIAVLNSGVGTAAVSLLFDVSSPGAWVVKFVTFMIAHVLIYSAAVSAYHVDLDAQG